MGIVKKYFNDLQFVRSARSKEKISNLAFALFVDAYIERLVFSINKSLSLKPIKEVSIYILNNLITDKKLNTFNFVSDDLEIIRDNIERDYNLMMVYRESIRDLPISAKVWDVKKE